MLDPLVQLYDRDTGRCEYAFKAFIAERLTHGALPLWAPFTEAGVSLLGQITPALFHPFTLLYALFPFELAFKLNHLLALPLAALGAAALPLALAGLHAFLERSSALRLLWSAGGLALTLLGGEPQSLLFGALLGAAGALAQASALRPRLPGVLRALRLLLAWGASALALAAPALLPALVQARRSTRAAGVSAWEHQVNEVPPLRLLGLALPFAFDEQLELLRPPEGRSPYFEYLAEPPWTTTPFSTSIALGAPALLFAAFAARHVDLGPSRRVVVVNREVARGPVGRGRADSFSHAHGAPAP